MTLYEFNALNVNDQAETIWEFVFIAEREDIDHRILLYPIDNFYVEVYYDKDFNVLRKFKSFDSTDELEPYLDKIDIPF